MTKHITILLILLFVVAAFSRESGREVTDPALVQARIEANRDRFDRVKRALQFMRQGDKVRLEASIAELVRQFEVAVAAYNSSLKTDADASALTFRLLGILSKLRILEVSVFQIAGKRKMTIAHLNKAVDRTDRALLKADKRVQKSGSSPDHFPALRKAHAVQDDAKQALADNNLLEAYRLTIKARQILGEAVAEVLDADDTEALLTSARAYWDETNEMIENAESSSEVRDNLKAVKSLEQVKQFQERAARMLDAEKPVPALRESRAARRMLMALRSDERQSDRFEERLRQVDVKFNQVLPRVSESTNARAKTLLLNGEEHLKKAKELSRDGKDEAARAQLLVAAKLIARASDALNDE